MSQLSSKPSAHLTRVAKKIVETFWGKGTLHIRGGYGVKDTYCVLGLLELTGDKRPRFNAPQHKCVYLDPYETDVSCDICDEVDEFSEEHIEARYATAVEYLEDAVHEEAPDADIVTFNDDGLTTREDILRVVKRAASAARRDGR